MCFTYIYLKPKKLALHSGCVVLGMIEVWARPAATCKQDEAQLSLLKLAQAEASLFPSTTQNEERTNTTASPSPFTTVSTSPRIQLHLKTQHNTLQHNTAQYKAQ